MITVKRLKELLKDLPDDAKCYGYEGEDVGIGIYTGDEGVIGAKKYWWIRASEGNHEDTHTEGFGEKM